MTVKTIRRITLVIALASVAGGLGYSWSVRRHRERMKDLKRQVEGWGGQAYSMRNTNPVFQPFRTRLGNDFVDSIVGFDGYSVQGPMNHRVEPDQLRQLLEFRPIRAFNAMSASNLGDDWIEGVRDPRVVHNLSLGCTAITDRSVPRLLEMAGLVNLNVEYTKLSDESLVRLLQLPRLDRLRVGGKDFRAIRLLDVWTVDGRDRPERRAGRVGKIKGRLAIDRRFGKPSRVEIATHQESASSTFGGYVKEFGEESPGVYTFELALRRLPPGLSTVRVEVEAGPPGKGPTIACRLPPSSIELVRPETPAGAPIPGP